MNTFLSLHSTDLLVLFTILIPLAAAILTLLLQRRVPVALDWISIISSLFSLAASLLIVPVVEKTPSHFLWFYLDSLSIYFILLVNLVALVASMCIRQFLEYDQHFNPLHNRVYFHFFFNLFHFTMLMVPIADNLILLWIFVELTTIVSTMLVRYQRTRPALEAAWKFITITTTGIIFALLGTLFLANSIPADILAKAETERLGLVNWSFLASRGTAVSLDGNWVTLSFLFILIGYGTKAGLAPMHTWLPDGHGEAPAPVSALLSGVMLKSALYAILRFYTIVNLNQGNNQFTSTMLLLCGLVSLVLAAPFILKTNKFKRVLAYHSLEHMGIITFGLGIGTPIALMGALLHTLNHAVTKALMFLVYGRIQYEYAEHYPRGEAQEADQIPIHGVLKSMPVSGIILTGGGLALVGSPPFNIFMSEFIILWAAIQQILAPQAGGNQPKVLIPAVVLFILSVTIIFGGLVYHLANILLDKPPFAPLEPSIRKIGRLIPFLILVVMILVFGITVPSIPVDFPDLLKNCVDILVNGVSS